LGTAAAAEPARRYEAALLKTLGAPRGQILRSFALRSALLGASLLLLAGLVGLSLNKGRKARATLADIEARKDG
jgi:predicted lysophospholipase L1 biosynthesis ABC-type transport system permease subunit